MERILFTLFMLWGFAYGQVCADDDTVRSNTATMITYNSARINGTTAHMTGAVTSIQLKYVRVGLTDTITSSGVAALRNITGLYASTQYYYYYKTICGSGTQSQTIGAYTFTTLANTIIYADERPTRFHYVYADSLLQIGAVDTSLYRAPTHPSIVYKSSDDTYYGYHLDCSCWQPLAIDSSGIIALLDDKVDSVTVSGDSLFYWKVGVSYGYILPSVATVWHTTGNAGIDTSTDFIGTTDNVDLPIKTNDVRRFTVNTSGALGIGATPDYGTSGYLLQSAGSAAAPAWVDHATLTTPLSNLTAAVATNSINNDNYAQTWAWNSKTSGNALSLGINGTAALSGQTVLDIKSQGANSGSAKVTYGLQITNSKTGTTSVNYAANFIASGGEQTHGALITSSGSNTANGISAFAQGIGANVGGRFGATGGTSNYAILVAPSEGSVGIGTLTPDSTLHVFGGFKYVNGSQGAGKYLTSDANGGATWGDLSLTASSTTTFTNKRWTARVGSTTSSATPTINTDNYDIYKLTAQTADITSMTTNLSGTPVDGDILEVQITGTAARAITWGASFVSSTVTLPTTTVTTATLTVILQYYSTSSYGNNKWVCVNYY